MKKQKLNTRILAVFFSAVFLLSVGYFFINSRLMNTIEKEEQTINYQRMRNAAEKLDDAIQQIRMDYLELADSSMFRMNSTNLSFYDLTELCESTRRILNNTSCYVNWMLLFPDNDYVVTKNGWYTRAEFFTRLMQNETYDLNFWTEVVETDFLQKYYPEEVFHTIVDVKGYCNEAMLPLVLKSYQEGSIITVLMLNMKQICDSADIYFSEGMYIFTTSGELCYTSDEKPYITSIPVGENHEGDTADYLVQNGEESNGLIYVKRLPESQAMTQTRYNFLFSLIIALVSLGVILVLVPISVKRLMAPVNRMVNILHQYAEPQHTYDIHGAYEVLEQILKNRDQQEAALAKRDAALSEYLLQSQLKNIYIDRQEEGVQQEGAAYILYIQIWYQEEKRRMFSVPVAEAESCLCDAMSDELNRLFETTVVFQPEPGRFAARVTLPRKEQIWDRITQFMKRLDEEREFATFTVVLSEELSDKVDLADVYNQLQDAVRQALICDKSQLLMLPLSEQTADGFTFTNRDQKRIYSHMRAGETKDAVAIAEEVMRSNLSHGINRAQMELLCVAIVNTAAFAVTELTPSVEKVAAASGVYNVLTTKCATAREYCDIVIGFIKTAGDIEAMPMEDDPLLQKIQKYIRENYRQEFDGEVMAKDLWVSRNYLSTYYKAKTGMNLSDSIQLYRIQKAIELLRDPEIKIGDIGPMVGIASNNTFLRQFKKHTGVTPKQWRMQNIE